MKDVYAIITTSEGMLSPETLPLALKAVWRRLLPYSVGGTFWCEDLNDKEIQQLTRLGFKIVKQKAYIEKNFVFYKQPLENINPMPEKRKRRFTSSGIGVIIGVNDVSDEKKFFDFVNYLREGIRLFNGHLLGGGTLKNNFYLTGFIPSGNIYLLQEALHAMKMALEVYDLPTRAIFYLSHFDTLGYEGKEIHIFDRYFVELIESIWNLEDFEIVAEKELLEKYPSMRTGLLFNPQPVKLLDKNFYKIQGISRRIDISKRIVDRREELSKLQKYAEECRKSQRFTVIGISGPFGIGKTSLALEFLRATIARGVDNIDTYFVDFERGFRTPLYGIKKIFESISPTPDFNVPSSDPFYINARLGYVILKELVEKGKVESDIPGSTTLTLIKVGLSKYFEYIQKPVIVVLDDIEFMDSVSREILFEIFNRSINFLSPITVILTSRKDAFFNGIKNIKDIIKLGPVEYTEPGIVHMVLKDEVDSSVAKYIYKIAGGHPFYIEQITKYLKEEGIIGKKDGAYKLLKKPPPKLSAGEVIQKRMKSLGEDISYILDIATLQDATLPLSFYSAILEKEESIFVSPTNEINRNTLMLQLIDNLNEVFYISRFALFRKIHLHNLLGDTKKSLHKKIVEVIENRFKDNLQMFYPVLAHHSKMAGLKDKELKYLKELYKEARDMNILPDCIKYLGRLIEIDPRNKNRYLRELADAYSDSGEWDKAISIFDTLIETTDDPGILSFAYREKAHIETFRGNFEEAHKLIDMAMGVALKSRNFADVAGAYLTKGTIFWAQGNIQKTLENYKKALETVLTHNIQGRNCIIYGNMGFIMYELGKMDDAAKWYFEALQHCKQENDYGTLANLYGNIAGLYERRKNFEEAKKYIVYSLDIARQKGFLQYEARGHLQLASIYMQTEKLEDAKEEASIALSLFREIGDVLGIFKTLLSLGKIAYMAGDTSHAIAHFVHALNEADRLNNPSLKIDAYMELAKVHEDDRSIKYLGLAYREASSYHIYDKLVEVAIQLARKFKKQEKMNEALRTLKDAIVRVDEAHKNALKEELERLRR